MRLRLFSFLSREFFNYFLPSLSCLVTLGLTISIGRLAAQAEGPLSLVDIVEVFALMTPQMLFIVTPLAFLISISITVTKLSGYHEIQALLTSRISTKKIFIIFLILSLTLLLFSLVNSLWLRPESAKQLYRSIYRNAFSRSFGDLSPGVIKKTGEGSFMLPGARGNQLENILYFKAGGPEKKLLSAKTAQIDSLRKIIVFRNGKVYLIQNKSLSVMSFDSLALNVYEDFNRDRKNILKGIVSTMELINLRNSPEFGNIAKAELCFRIFLPLSLVPILFISFPLSLKASSDYKTRGLMISAVTGIFFFGAFSLINNLAKKGIIDPFLGFFGLFSLFFVTGLLTYRLKFLAVKRFH